MLRVLVAAEALVAGEVELAGDEHQYLARVRRAAVGDPLVAFDGAGRHAKGAIVAIDAARTRIRLDAVEQEPPPAPHLTALVPLIKGDRLDLCVEKLAEVGVDAIALYVAARAVVRLDGDRAAARTGRLAAVAAAATRQSGRAAAPAVTGPVPLAEALAAAAAADVRWVALPAADPPVLARAPARLAILTGPEGGLAPDELAAAAAAGFVPVGLGPFVLRAETAPVVAAAHARIACAGLPREFASDGIAAI
jgi:16S rRNA (uracil1498-N3)-methyltransferase